MNHNFTSSLKGNFNTENKQKYIIFQAYSIGIRSGQYEVQSRISSRPVCETHTNLHRGIQYTGFHVQTIFSAQAFIHFFRNFYKVGQEDVNPDILVSRIF
jgi:hypothetical protein